MATQRIIKLEAMAVFRIVSFDMDFKLGLVMLMRLNIVSKYIKFDST